MIGVGTPERSEVIVTGINWSPAAAITSLHLPRQATILVELVGGGYKLVPFHCINISRNGSYTTVYLGEEDLSKWQFVVGYAVVDTGE